MYIRREPAHLDLPPPTYDPSLRILSIAIHGGGKLQRTPEPKYIGGRLLAIFDFCDWIDCKERQLDAWSRMLLGEGRRRYHIIHQDRFEQMHEIVLIYYFGLHLKEGLINIYVEDLNVEDAQTQIAEDCGGNREENHVDMEDDDCIELERNTLEKEKGKGKLKEIGKGKRKEKVQEDEYSGCDDWWIDVGDEVISQLGDRIDNEDDDLEYVDPDYVLEEENGEDDDALFEKNVENEEGLDNGNEPEVGDIGEEAERSEEDVVHNEGPDFDEGRLSNEDGDEVEAAPTFDPRQSFNPTFILKMIFSSKIEVRRAVHSHAIKTRRSLFFKKNDERRMYVRCEGVDCEWRMNILKVKGQCTWQLREYIPDHTGACGPSNDVKNIKSKWLAENYLQRFKSDPNRRVNGFMLDAINELNVQVSRDKAYRAKKRALDMIEGNPDDQYTKLWDYKEELKRSNPGSTAVLGTEEDLEGNERFSRIYVCFHALKEGFRAGCRPIIGIDGCWLKGPHGGILLSAVGVDANNHYYPIAWAVVKNETGETWEWFLQILKMDLHISRGYEYTFISDKQKGLIKAISEVFPGSEHRFCVKHLHNNFKTAGFRGLAFKYRLWDAAQATTEGEFNLKMQKMRELSDDAANWFLDKPASQWSKSGFSPAPKCDMLLNNCCESFNAKILDAREKPIITMLEWIREYIVKRHTELRDRAQRRWNRRLCPRIRAILQEHIDQVGSCIPMKSDNQHYQVHVYGGSQYCVDLAARTCTCRRWDLSGIPCKHAICALYDQKQDPVEWVDECYTVDCFKQIYNTPILGINGTDLWGQTMFIPPLPPNFGRKVGRPTKARRMEADEAPIKRRRRRDGHPIRMKRQQVTLKCGKCGNPGHNSRKCKNVEVEIQQDGGNPSGGQARRIPVEVLDDMNSSGEQARGIPVEVQEYMNSSGGQSHDIPVEVLQEGSPSGASNTHSQEPTRDRQLVNSKPGKNILPPITESLPDLHQMSTEATHEVYKAANTPRCEHIRGPSMWEQATGSQPTPPALMTLANIINRRAPAQGGKNLNKSKKSSKK